MNNPRRGRGRSGRRPNIPTRSQNFDSNGPEGRVRGNAQQVYEKYLALARDAQVSGDRVLAEAFQQHAEHYYRVMSDSTDPDQRPREHQQGQSQQGQSQQGQYQRDDEDEGDSRQQERGYERRDEAEAQQERRGDEGRNERRGERRHDERRQGEHRPNGEQRSDGESRPNGEAADANGLSREAEAREGRLRDRFNRRNGEGILTRRRGGDLDKGSDREGGGEEEADAGLRKMLGEENRPQGAASAEPDAPAAAEAPRTEAPAPEAPAPEAAGEAVEAAPVKPRRRRRTKAEMEKDSTEQTAE